MELYMTAATSTRPGQVMRRSPKAAGAAPSHGSQITAVTSNGSVSSVAITPSSNQISSMACHAQLLRIGDDAGGQADRQTRPWSYPPPTSKGPRNESCKRAHQSLLLLLLPTMWDEIIGDGGQNATLRGLGLAPFLLTLLTRSSRSHLGEMPRRDQEIGRSPENRMHANLVAVAVGTPLWIQTARLPASSAGNHCTPASSSGETGAERLVSTET
ncbi:uncharacterized protein KD926_002220 [Aspergillus affinis]|uniref:uncharacterized protein n=1 Tax=Aspergillus affinis TaxID=1070780 RepID=UPI0022FE5A8B|nr:uncharacterized protein KD926_002220 [Aspergillus affinis]KAI9036190.1 hypothetical protein KD926_002220 [Aspergillus affinis]